MDELKRKVPRRPLLTEPEVCPECNKVFMSIYTLRDCKQHKNLEPLLQSARQNKNKKM